MFAKAKRFAVAHKIITIIVLVLIGGGVYYFYTRAQAAPAATKYVVEKASTGTVVASVSGSGQMQAVSTIDLKPQNSATVVSIPVKVGEHVKAGQLLVQLDTTAEARALAQARLQLQSAQLSLAKLTQSPATTTLIQDQNAVTQGQANIVTASTTLAKDYQTGFDALANTFVDFQNVMSGLQNFVLGNDVSKAQNDPDAYLNLMPSYLQASTRPYRDDVISTYNAAGEAYQQNLADYRATSRVAGPAVLDPLFTETYHTSQAISDAVKAVKNLLDYVVNNYPRGSGYAQLPSVTATLQTNFGSYTNTASGDVGNLSNAISTITADRAAFTNAELSLAQSSSTLAALLAGADPLDVQSNQLSLQQQEFSVQTAEENLANDSIRAPVAGIVSALPSVIGATVASPAVSIVGSNQVAQITLNEVDAAKVQVGDKATLTFDAVSGLSLAGQVVEIDPVGTVSQGVVSYNAQIALASPNDAVRPGMSVSANIVTQMAQDVLAVPNSAIVTQGTSKYVLEPSQPLSDTDLSTSQSGGIILPAPPNRVPVTVGLSNSTQTQILTGVNEGDQIITRTLSGSAAASPATGGTNALRGLGGGGFGGGGGAVFRAGGG